MNITTANGKQLRGDLIKSAVTRYDLAPVPSTFEGEFRVDDDLRKQFAEGQIINVNGDDYRIIKPVGGSGRESQGQRDTSAMHIIALLDACHPVTFVRQKAIIKENALLTEIYRAAGASIKPVDGDFKTGRFVCMVGETPSFHIARVLQEEGGVVRWKSGKLQFFRLADLFKQNPFMSLPDNASEDSKSDFLSRHEIPSFYSLADDGSVVYGNRAKARSARFVPGKNQQQLINMSRCLVQRKVAKISFNAGLRAGDLIDISGSSPLAVVTAAHVFQSGTDGSGSDQYTKVWMSAIEG
ncbi:MAG: hypothetical protein ACXWT0_00340 [Methylobacter sp.]